MSGTTIQQIVGDVNRSESQFFVNVAIVDRRYYVIPTGDKLEEDLQNWLAPPDPWKNHNDACALRHTGTGTWFIQGDTFSEWKASGPGFLLWIHGKRKHLSSTCIFEL